MAAGLTIDERRGTTRVPPEHTPWRRHALLRPGQDAEVINLSVSGALIASPNRMNPGMRTELQLFGSLRRTVRGRIDRCRVTGVDPLRFEGAIVFDEPFEWVGSG